MADGRFQGSADPAPVNALQPRRPRPRRRLVQQGPAPARADAAQGRPPTPPNPETNADSPLELVNSVTGVASFVGALMLYAGYIYTHAYFGYFHLDSFAVGFDTFELIVRSLRLATLPALEVLALVLLAPRLPQLLKSLRVPEHHVRRLQGASRSVARAYLAIVIAGVVLMLLWSWIQPFGWAAPLLVAAGLLLGRAEAANSCGQQREPAWQRAASFLVAGLFLIWVVALVAGQLGTQDARNDADQLVRRVSVVVLSTDRLSIAPPGPKVEDLGKNAHYRYRYTGLRLLVERDHVYYLLPLGWKQDIDPTYVIEDDDSIRIELRPGTQPRI